MMDIFTLSFIFGMKHAIEADHFSAVAALATRNLSGNSLVKTAAMWGVGHTVTLFIVGMLVLSFGASIPETFAKNLEFLVGVMLIVLGADVIRRIKKDRMIIQSNFKDNIKIYSHRESLLNECPHAHDKYFNIRSLIVGSVHGLAGSGALIIIALGTVDSYQQGIIYILFFGIGSIAGMIFLSVIIALPLKAASINSSYVKNFNILSHAAFKGSIGMATIIVGFCLIYETASLSWL